MEFYLAVDGGGSKTKIALYDARGVQHGILSVGPSAYCDIGVSAVTTVLYEGIQALFSQVGATWAELKQAAFCLSSVGERPSLDAQLTEQLVALCKNAVVVNDSYCALYAAHGGGEGIVAVSGTGSIACGLDSQGNTARCGGYSPMFSDEGSAYWLGVKAMELFCKQDDGRVERSVLHTAFAQRLGVRSAFELMEWAEHARTGGRRRFAKLQLLLEAAANDGDASAASLYEQAARELSLLCSGLLSKLSFRNSPVKVSFSGGTFRAGKWVLEPFSRFLEENNCTLSRPLLDVPVKGAAILCLSAAGIPITDSLIDTLRGS